MDILVADLDEHAPGLSQKVVGNDEPISQIGQVGVDALLPGIAERPDLLGLARQRRSSLPSLTSRLRVLTCQFDPNLIP